MKILTTSTAAARLGLSAIRVRKICQQHNIGTLLTDRMRTLTEADLPLIEAARGRVGNPNFGQPKRKAKRQKPKSS